MLGSFKLIARVLTEDKAS